MTLGLLGLVAASCGGPRAPAGHPAGPVVVDAHHGYFLLSDGSVHFVGEGEPLGLHVLGVIEGGRFVPQGDVLGDGALGESGSEGWLELPDGSFLAAQSGRQPTRPYIEGTMTTDGVFSPRTRQVVY